MTSILLRNLVVRIAFCIPAILGMITTEVSAAEDTVRPERPNVVLINCDDLGYADIGCYGAKEWTTPAIDRLAAGGRRFTSCCVAQAVCSASRAGLLTGCYPNRIGIFGALSHVSKNGISNDETTMAEMFRNRGYATAIYGKWHLGHHPQFLPLKHGFDEYWGLPYSNDMWPKHPTGTYPPLPLIENDRILEYNPDQRILTTTIADKAVHFIQRHKETPFFLYVAHPMPHVPLHVLDKDRHLGERLYGDVIREIDDSVAAIVKTLAETGLTNNTLVIFTSDNGPWLSYGDHAGSALPFREGKGTMWEGGVRVPFIIHWPGTIAPGTTSNGLISTIDVLPSLARLVASELPTHKIDGEDRLDDLLGAEDAKPRGELFYYYGAELRAVRKGDWKLYFPHTYIHVDMPGTDGKPGKLSNRKVTNLELYNLAADIGEQHDVAAEHADIVAELSKLGEAARADLGDSLTKAKGTGQRPAGQWNGTDVVPGPQIPTSSPEGRDQ